MVFKRKMVREKCTLGRGLKPSPQENISVPLSKHICLPVFTVRQELSLCHYLYWNWENSLGGGGGPFGFLGGAFPTVD